MIYFFLIKFIIKHDPKDADKVAHIRQYSYVSSGSHHETHHRKFQDIYK